MVGRRSLVLVILAACASACADEASSGSAAEDRDPPAVEGSRRGADDDTTHSPRATSAGDPIEPNVAVMRTERGDIRFVYRVEDNVLVAEGDILIPTNTAETRSAATSWTYRRWPGGVVPYVISGDLPDHARVTDAIAHWEATTAVRFAARTNEADYVEFHSGTGCSSYIGKIGNRQYVDLATGERASNVVGIAIDRTSDRVAYYYARGFATIGSATRAAAYKAHFKYALPAGKTPADIVDVAGTPSGTIVAWYEDGTMSEGSFADLGAKSSGGAATPPAGKTWANVQAIAIDGQSKVHAFYRDGTTSIGTTTDLGAIAAPAPFTVAAGKTAASLAHADVRADGSYFALYSNGDTSTGTATELAATTPAGRVTFTGHCGKGTVVHEIGHAVGLLHEQTRVDRDDHVTVNYANIEAGHSSNFDKHSVTSAADHGAYDFASVMHYDSYAFSKNGQPTITKKDGSTFTANRTALSAGDVASIATLYP